MFDVVNTRIQLHNCAEHLANQLNKRVAPVLHKGSVHVTRGNDFLEFGGLMRGKARQ